MSGSDQGTGHHDAEARTSDSAVAATSDPPLTTAALVDVIRRVVQEEVAKAVPEQLPLPCSPPAASVPSSAGKLAL